MTICLSDAGKRFNRDWVFRHFNYDFETGRSYAITGSNGSGKSTLLQCLAGSMMLSEGHARWKYNGTKLDEEKLFRHVSICAPYLELVEEMTLQEFLHFHQVFKPFIDGQTVDSLISLIGLEKAANKQIRNFSSGMKQRVKLAQCILTDTAIVLLDEPCTNLDRVGIDLYHQLIDRFCQDRLVIVSSNDEVEYTFAKERVSMAEYKFGNSAM